MLNPIYNLPNIHFVGGESQTFLFRLLTLSGQDFNAEECDVVFAVINYANKNGLPILTKTATILTGASGIKNVARVDLDSEDTVYLYGRYIYQITARDQDGITDIPGQGIIDIVRNIHTEYITK